MKFSSLFGALPGHNITVTVGIFKSVFGQSGIPSQFDCTSVLLYFSSTVPQFYFTSVLLYLSSTVPQFYCTTVHISGHVPLSSPSSPTPSTARRPRSDAGGGDCPCPPPSWRPYVGNKLCGGSVSSPRLTLLKNSTVMSAAALGETPYQPSWPEHSWQCLSASNHDGRNGLAPLVHHSRGMLGLFWCSCSLPIDRSNR